MKLLKPTTLAIAMALASTAYASDGIGIGKQTVTYDRGGAVAARGGAASARPASRPVIVPAVGSGSQDDRRR